MAKRVFTDYYMADGERLKGYTAANIAFGINAADSGMPFFLKFPSIPLPFS